MSSVKKYIYRFLSYVTLGESKKKYKKQYRALKTLKNLQEQINALYKNKEKIKLVIGSGGLNQQGWISTDKKELDLLNFASWDFLFHNNSIDYILAEHVWEHLTLEEGRKGIENCLKFLKVGGQLRIAVPDGFHSNKKYIERVKPNGWGMGSDDHKVLYTYKMFETLTEGLDCRLDFLEFFDENATFFHKPWKQEEGMIMRSFENDARNTKTENNYSSLIVDIVKIESSLS